MMIMRMNQLLLQILKIAIRFLFTFLITNSIKNSYISNLPELNTLSNSYHAEETNNINSYTSELSVITTLNNPYSSQQTLSDSDINSHTSELSESSAFNEAKNTEMITGQKLDDSEYSELPNEIKQADIIFNSTTNLNEAENEIIIDKMNQTNNFNKTIQIIIDNLFKELNLTEIDNGIDKKIIEKNLVIVLTSTLNQKNNEDENNITLDLGQCEDKLKNDYKISDNDALYILQIISEEEGMKIPKVGYEVYYPLYDKNNLTKLDLSSCKDTKIEITISVKINDTLDKYNASSGYYNDICYKTTSQYDTDISLKDRRNEFVYNNMTLCEENCELKEYDYEKEKVTCSCDIKLSIPENYIFKFNKKEYFKSFIDYKNIANLNILKCYKVVLKIKHLLNNYGFYIMSSILILYFLTLIIFACTSFSKIKKDINYIITFLNTTKIIKIENVVQIPVRNKKKQNTQKTLNTQKTQNTIKTQNTGKTQKKEKNKKNDKKPNNINELKNINNKNNEIKNNNNKSNKIMKNKRKKRKQTKKEKLKNKSKLEKRKGSFSGQETLNMSDQSFNKINKTGDENGKYIKELMEQKDFELNSLEYEEAIKLDQRNYFQYYISLIKNDHPLIFSFGPYNDYNSRIIKFFLFFFSFSLDFTVNALFFNDDTMHKIYVDRGKFNFLYQLPQILYSTLISRFIDALIKNLALSQDRIVELKQEKEKANLDTIHHRKIIRNLKIIILAFFSYYIACFCGIYENTQIILIKDSVISLITSFFLPFGMLLIPGIFRIISLRVEKPTRKFLYKFSAFLESYMG